jgi:hypothetical protein
VRALLLLAAFLALAAPAAAADPLCLTAPVPAPTKRPLPLRFGITPLLAGTAGSAQGETLPEDPAKTAAALTALQPPGKRLVMRINRVFSGDGDAGLDRAAALTEQYERAGFDVESQVRYHPAAEQDGDLDAWEAYVRRAVDRLAASPALVSLTITNEVNLPLSANTSDGAYRNARAAIVRGTVAAHEELARLGRRDVELGFSYAYRYLPNADVRFWKDIGGFATPAFREAVDYVGVQLYPGLFFPPVLTPGQTAGDATIDALALVRDCYMPLAGLGDDVRIWISENGYPTNLGHGEAEQAANLASTVASVSTFSRALGVTDYRYFNLRDNRPNGTDLFDDVGLLGADYVAKPAFAAFRDLVAQYGRRPARRGCRYTVRVLRGRTRVTIDGRRTRARVRRSRVVFRLPPGRHHVRVVSRRGGDTITIVRPRATCPSGR